MNILVTAASRHGGTNEIAEAIGAALREAGVNAEVRRPGEVESVERYDAVVLGSAVYVGRWLDEAKTFAQRHADALRRRPVWLFSSGPLGDPPKPEEESVEAGPLVEMTGARDHRTFPGELARERLGLGERAIVKMVRAPYGDFRDWVAIRTFADRIATELPVGAAGGRD
jgi:menaquinone-dependent protoporphyrinogen oxidase